MRSDRAWSTLWIKGVRVIKKSKIALTRNLLNLARRTGSLKADVLGDLCFQRNRPAKRRLPLLLPLYFQRREQAIKLEYLEKEILGGTIDGSLEEIQFVIEDKANFRLTRREQRCLRPGRI